MRYQCAVVVGVFRRVSPFVSLVRDRVRNESKRFLTARGLWHTRGESELTESVCVNDRFSRLRATRLPSVSRRSSLSLSFRAIVRAEEERTKSDIRVCENVSRGRRRFFRERPRRETAKSELSAVNRSEWERDRTRKKEGDAVRPSQLIRTCRDVGWHGGRPWHRRRVQEVRAEHIQQEQVQQLLQAEGGAQRGGSGMQQGEFCLMDFFYLLSPRNPLPRSFRLLLFRYRALTFSPLLPPLASSSVSHSFFLLRLPLSYVSMHM